MVRVHIVEAGLTHGHITCNSLDLGTVNTKMLLAGWGPCGIDVEDALGMYIVHTIQLLLGSMTLLRRDCSVV